MGGGAALVFSGLCLAFMDPLLRTLGTSDRTIGYARQYLLFVVVLGGLSMDMTRHYLHVQEPVRQAAAERFSEAFGK